MERSLQHGAALTCALHGRDTSQVPVITGCIGMSDVDPRRWQEQIRPQRSGNSGFVTTRVTTTVLYVITNTSQARQNRQFAGYFMRPSGLEPPRTKAVHKALNLARLPIPPQAQSTRVYPRPDP